jgi:hypothetical protein
MVAVNELGNGLAKAVKPPLPAEHEVILKV